MTKWRSNQDFAALYASNKQGFDVGIDNFVHIADESSTPGTFVAPSIGTQGSSTSAATPSTDISASSNRNLKLAVDGLAAVTANLSTVAGLNTGVAIDAALETAANAALSAAGQDARVWVAFVGGLHVFKSQKTGTTSAVVITAAASLNLAVELKLGLANTGVEAVGTAGGAFLWQTKASLKGTQPFKQSEHKSGRQALNIVKQKKTADGDIECYLNVGTGGSPTIDTGLDLIMQALFGRKVVTGSTSIAYDAGNPPTKYLSIVQGSTIFSRLMNGAYPKTAVISLPGDGEAKITFAMKGRQVAYAALAQVLGAVIASPNVILQAGESKKFSQIADSTGNSIPTRVMIVDTDGRTVLYGGDGSLLISSRVDGSDELILSASVSCSTLCYVVPWLPHCFDQNGTDNPVTGLQGTLSFDGGTTTIGEIKSAELTYDPKVADQDGWWGTDTNQGRIVGEKADIKVKVDMLLDAQQFKYIINALEFSPANIKIVLGDAASRRWEFDFPKVYLKAPDIPLPDSGPVVATFEGMAVQSSSGALDAVTWKLL